MPRQLRWLVPRTIRGQITIIILLALLTIIAMGQELEKWAGDGDTAPDLENMNDRMVAVAVLMGPATPQEREKMLATTRRAGWDLSLAPMSTAERLQTSSPRQTIFSWAADWLFPPDGPTPLGGWRTFLDDRRVLANRVDDSTILLLSGFPNSFMSSSAVSQGYTYFAAIIVLMGFFFVFAIRAITEPIKRISHAATDSDIKNGSEIFEERGTVEIVALARALNGMRNRIRLMMDGRTRMLRGIGHDLRTPLTRLRLRAERMADAPLRDALLTDIDRIDGLLAESLNYLRDDYANETVERVDVASILQTVCSDFSDVGFSVSYRGPNRFVAHCRPLSITRAVTNLCDNAVKFARTVEVQISEQHDGFVISVSDDGPGIPAALRERVFEPFYKADTARTNGKAGFGLGLSIVADIAHAHRGTIELLARNPTGLTARLIVPNLTA